MLPRDRMRKRALKEVEDHFREALAEELSHGAQEDQAAEKVIARFGNAAEVAASFVVRNELNRAGRNGRSTVVANGFAAALLFGYGVLSAIRDPTPATFLTAGFLTVFGCAVALFYWRVIDVAMSTDEEPRGIAL